MRHAGDGGTPAAFELLGQHRYLRAQAASNIWLGSLYVSIAGNLDPPSRLKPSDSIDAANMDAPYRISHPKILREFGEIYKTIPRKIGAEIGAIIRPLAPGLHVASNPFQGTRF